MLLELLLLTGLAVLLPAGKGSEESGQVIVVHLGKGEALAFDEVLEKVVSLDVQVVNGLIHSLDSTLGGSNEILICNYLINELLLG